MTEFYFGKTRENTGKQRKTCKNMGKHWMTKFYFRKTWENTVETQENTVTGRIFEKFGLVCVFVYFYLHFSYFFCCLWHLFGKY